MVHTRIGIGLHIYQFNIFTSSYHIFYKKNIIILPYSQHDQFGPDVVQVPETVTVVFKKASILTIWLSPKI